MNWSEHERECPSDWVHLYFDHAQRSDQTRGKQARRVKSSDCDAPKSIRNLIAQMLLKGALWVRADGFRCFIHGDWVSITAGLESSGRPRVIHFTISAEGAKDEALAFAILREASAPGACQTTTEQMGKVLKHFPAAAAAALNHGNSGGDGVTSVLDCSGITVVDTEGLSGLLGEDVGQSFADNP